MDLFFIEQLKSNYYTGPLADLGGVPGAHPPMGPNSFVFAYIFTEKCPRRRSMPSLMGARPPTGNPGPATAGQ